MSFDIFLMSYPQETFDRGVVLAAFEAADVSLSGEDGWTFHPPEGKLYTADEASGFEPEVTCFSVNRPPGGAFWTAIFNVLKDTRTFLAWPATDPPTYCVANPTLKSFVHPEMDHMGEPAFVESGSDIERAIDASFASLR
jgi:hypothetical protein